MIDPFTAWSRMVRAGLDMQSTWLRGVETLQASQTVITARTDKMRDAIASPMQGDFDEFSRMVPEKIDAFSRSTLFVTRTAMANHRAWMIYLRRVGALMTSGRLPTVGESAVFAEQTVEYALNAVAAGAHLGHGALRPVHCIATANARRLAKKEVGTARV